MKKTPLHHPDAPPPSRPYSPGLAVGPLVMLSGQLGIDPVTGEIAGADIKSQTARALENVRSLLQQAELDLSDVIKVTVFLRDIDDFADMNEVYGSFFAEPRPARSTIAGAVLPRPEYRIEVEAMSFRG